MKQIKKYLNHMPLAERTKGVSRRAKHGQRLAVAMMWSLRNMMDAGKGAAVRKRKEAQKA